MFITDTETTGFSKINNDLIVISAEIRDFNYDLKDEITLYAAPKNKERWNKHAEKVHGFSYEEARLFPNPRKTSIELLHFLKPFKHKRNLPLLFISHDNNAFDFNFIEWLYRWENLQYSYWKVFNRDYRLSTVKMGKEAGYEQNKLNIWAERIGFDLDHHEAGSDRRGCSKVFKYLIEQNNGMGINQQKRDSNKKSIQV